jgi:hypothetical protein
MKEEPPAFYAGECQSTPMLRRQWCREEVLVNAPLAPGIYLGVVPIVRTQREEMHIGPIFSPESVPEPASLLEGGTVVDYAVVISNPFS